MTARLIALTHDTFFAPHTEQNPGTTGSPASTTELSYSLYRSACEGSTGRETEGGRDLGASEPTSMPKSWEFGGKSRIYLRVIGNR